jgi:hypoxanthine phosphoribosyltransferase
MQRLKGVIFSLRDVIFHKGQSDPILFAQLEKLILWLKSKGVQPVFVANHSWAFTSEDGTKQDVRQVLKARWGDCPWYIASEGDMPFKPLAAAMQTVLAKQGWKHTEAIFVGNNDDDMKTARNGGLLFLNAMWHGEASPYGYQFESPLDVARFVDCFCIGATDWFWSISDGPLRVYAIAPFSTLSPRYADAQPYSAHARNTAKHLGGDATFWGRLLASRVYFSGLVDEIHYITSYPGHSTLSQQPVVTDALTILADSLRRKYLPDLILRHSTATKSQNARIAGNVVDHANQIKTIRLERFPTKTKQGERYKVSPIRSGKTVLVVDDICTQGNSFESARAFIEKAGASCILLAWLKTINTDYQAIKGALPITDPFANIAASIGTIPVKTYSFASAIRNGSATANLSDVFQRYYEWDWPASV